MAYFNYLYSFGYFWAIGFLQLQRGAPRGFTPDRTTPGVSSGWSLMAFSPRYGGSQPMEWVAPVP
jgi:hypothetical protein